jgi:hypothetical protein
MQKNKHVMRIIVVVNEAAVKINTLQGIESNVVVEVLNAKQRHVLPKKMFRE